MANAFGLARRINKSIDPFIGPANLSGRSLYVNGSSGVDAGRNGLNPNKPLATIAQALTNAAALDTIFIDPGTYDEALTVPYAKTDISIVGLGGAHGVIIAPSTTNASGITNEADRLTLSNLEVRGDGTGSGLINRGSKLRCYGCLFGVAGAVGATLSEGTDAQVTAGTHGTGTDPHFFNCDFKGVATGVLISATDEGPMWGIRFESCWFHDLPTASIAEGGGTAANRFRDLVVRDCHFGAGDPDDGSAPTKWADLNDDNGNTGQFVGCSFPGAINSGDNLVSTAITWVGNVHTGGIAAAQPS